MNTINETKFKGADVNSFAAVDRIIVTTEGYSFATEKDFADKTKWDTGIKAGDIIILPTLMNFEAEDPEPNIYESGLKKQVYLGDNPYKFKANVCVPLEVHKELRKLSGKNVRIFKADKNNNILGTVADGKVRGFSTDMFAVSSMTSAGLDTPALTPISVQESDPSEFNKNGVFVTPTWAVIELDYVEATPVTPKS